MMPRRNLSLLSLRAPRRAMHLRVTALAAIAVLPFIPGTSVLADDAAPAPAATTSAAPEELLPLAAPADETLAAAQAENPTAETDADAAEDAALESDAADDDGTDLGQGVASYYAARFHGRRTASGETFSNNAMTAAHRSLPFGSMVRVTNPRSGASVVVRINDRGPFTRGRTIDLSRAAAERVGIVRAGHGTVELTLLEG